MRIAVDAMGGDHAPKAVIDGVIKGIEAFDDRSPYHTCR